jgi:hypothetical protein
MDRVKIIVKGYRGFIHWTVTASAFLHYIQNTRHMNLEILSDNLLFLRITTLFIQLPSGISLRTFTDLLNRLTSAIVPPALCHTSATPLSQRPNLKRTERSSGTLMPLTRLSEQRIWSAKPLIPATLLLSRLLRSLQLRDSRNVERNRDDAHGVYISGRLHVHRDYMLAGMVA